MLLGSPHLQEAQKPRELQRHLQVKPLEVLPGPPRVQQLVLQV